MVAMIICAVREIGAEHERDLEMHSDYHDHERYSTYCRWCKIEQKKKKKKKKGA